MPAPAEPVRAQAALEAVARLDANYSHGVEEPDESDMRIVLEYARQAGRHPEPRAACGGQMTVAVGQRVELVGADVEVSILEVRTPPGTARLEWRFPPPLVERSGPCKSCGRAFSPDHDITAGGPTVRHPFQSGRPGPGVRGVCV